MSYVKLINNIKKWFNKPYYFNDSNSFKLKISIGFGLLVFILLVIFKPANINTTTLFKLSIGCITTLNLLSFFFVITKLFPKFFKSETWTVGKHFIIILGLFIFSSTIRWFYLNTVLPEKIDEAEMSFLKMLRQSFVIGFIVVFLYIYLDEKHQYKKYSSNSIDIKKDTDVLIKPKVSQTNNSITIHTTNKNDFLTFFINDLVYITSESNYAFFYLKKDSKKGFEIEKKTLRISLQILEEKLKQYTRIIRCHKSYIINASYVNDISGNARGYYLHIKENKKEIPVSRKFTKEELKKIIVF